MPLSVWWQYQALVWLRWRVVAAGWGLSSAMSDRKLLLGRWGSDSWVQGVQSTLLSAALILCIFYILSYTCRAVSTHLSPLSHLSIAVAVLVSNTFFISPPDDGWMNFCPLVSMSDNTSRKTKGFKEHVPNLLGGRGGMLLSTYVCVRVHERKSLWQVLQMRQYCRYLLTWRAPCPLLTKKNRRHKSRAVSEMEDLPHAEKHGGA